MNENEIPEILNEPIPTEEPADDAEGISPKKEDQATECHERLAEDFRDLCREMPETFAGISDVPDEVIELAVDRNISLFDAFLRHAFYEDRRIREVADAEREAAAHAAGSLASPPAQPHPEIDAFVSSFRQSLR